MSISRTTHITIIFLASLLFTTPGWSQADAETDAVSGASPEAPAIDDSKELPVRLIPNIPPAGEAYYAPDDYHLIAQARDPDAQKTDARQTNQALLLSDDAKLNTKPQLEIFADDVKCTH